MPHYCCVPKCKQKGTIATTGEKVSFHVFPRDKALKKLWLNKIKRDEDQFFKVTQSTRICSLHFLVTDFWPGVASGRKLLKDDSVPSIFPWTQSSTSLRRKNTFKSKNISSAASSMLINEATNETPYYNVDTEQSSVATMEYSSTLSEPSSSRLEPRSFSLDVIGASGLQYLFHENKEYPSQSSKNNCCAKANEEIRHLNEIIRIQKQEISSSEGEISTMKEYISQQNNLVDKLEADKRNIEKTVLDLQKKIASMSEDMCI